MGMGFGSDDYDDSSERTLQRLMPSIEERDGSMNEVEKNFDSEKVRNLLTGEIVDTSDGLDITFVPPKLKVEPELKPVQRWFNNFREKRIKPIVRWWNRVKVLPSIFRHYLRIRMFLFLCGIGFDMNLSKLDSIERGWVYFELVTSSRAFKACVADLNKDLVVPRRLSKWRRFLRYVANFDLKWHERSEEDDPGID